jgi:glycosyltransferase involved in cell wall biosynthesis
MKNTLVSVIMPVYNSEKYLKAAIESVLSQSYENIELIVVDNASVDSTREIVLSYTDSRIRLVKNEINSGIVYSRNKGIELATGSFVATLDSDDIAMPDRLARQVDFLERHPEYGMCGTFYNLIDGQDKFLRKVVYPTGSRDIKTHLTLGNCFGNSTIMIRSHIAKELRYRKEFEIIEDYDLWYRISRMSEVANLPFFGTAYRMHGNNLSVEKVNEMLMLVKKMNGRILTDLHIGFSEKELDIHANFLLRNFEYFSDDTHFADLGSWVTGLYNRLKDETEFNPALLYGLLAENWIVITFKLKRYSGLFNNRLFRMNRVIYLNRFWKRVWIRIKKSE